MDGSSINGEIQTSNSRYVITDSLLPSTNITSEFSSSLSELDPMLNNRSRTPSPTVNQSIVTISTDDKVFLTATIDTPSSIIENQSSVSVENSIRNVSEKIEHSILSSSSSISNDNELNDLNIEKKTDDLLQVTQEDTLDLP